MIKLKVIIFGGSIIVYITAVHIDNIIEAACILAYKFL